MSFAAELSLHHTTRRLCTAFIDDPHGSVLLYGGEGCGLLTLARAIGRQLDNQPENTMVITADNSADITIDQIRQLYHDTRSARTDHLTVVIDDADRMNVPAQNAFLKLLEEPPSHVVFVMTSHAPHLLLPTIRSRVAAIEVRPISAEASRNMLQHLGVDDPTRQSQIMFLASGRPAGIAALVQDETHFQQRADLIRFARNVLQSTMYQRIIDLASVGNDRTAAIETMQTLGRIVQHNLPHASAASSAARLNTIADAIEHLQSNANVKLQLLTVALQL